jgi:predicted transcriptional regulator
MAMAIDAAAVKAYLEGAHGIAVTEARAAEIARDVNTLAKGVREAAARLAFEDEPQAFRTVLAACARPS